jgi:hypothetical protein
MSYLDAKAASNEQLVAGERGIGSFSTGFRLQSRFASSRSQKPPATEIENTDLDLTTKRSPIQFLADWA